MECKNKIGGCDYETAKISFLYLGEMAATGGAFNPYRDEGLPIDHVLSIFKGITEEIKRYNEHLFSREENRTNNKNE